MGLGRQHLGACGTQVSSDIRYGGQQNASLLSPTPRGASALGPLPLSTFQARRHKCISQGSSVLFRFRQQDTLPSGMDCTSDRGPHPAARWPVNELSREGVRSAGSHILVPRTWVTAMVGRSPELPDPRRTALLSDLNTSSWGGGNLAFLSLGHPVTLKTPNSLEQ